MLLGAKLRPFASHPTVLPCIRHCDLLCCVTCCLDQRAHKSSWKTRATAPGRASRSRSSNSRDQGEKRFDFQNKGSDGSSRNSSSRDRQASYRQQQLQQQRRPWQEAAARDDRESWDDYDDEADGGNDRSYDDDFRYPARPSKAAYRDELFGEALYGVAPVLAALKSGSRTPHVLLLQEGLSPQQRKDVRALQEIQRLVQDKGATVRIVSKHQLNMLSGNRPHQGLILDASPLEWQSLEVFPAAEDVQQQQQQLQQGGEQNAATAAADVRYPVWLALDEVVDPQNLGAMLRSALCLGASGVLACSRNCAPLTPTVSKASAGAAELLTLHSCRSMPRTLADAASKGWSVVGAAAEAEAVPLKELKVDRPTVLVMGNEGYGLRPTVKRCCTQLVQIEMATAASSNSSTAFQLVDSLNPDSMHWCLHPKLFHPIVLLTLKFKPDETPNYLERRRSLLHKPHFES